MRLMSHFQVKCAGKKYSGKKEKNVKGMMNLTRRPNPPFLATIVADPSPVTYAEVVTAVALAAGLLARVAAPPPNTMI
jgi:hypothetical protein